MTGCWVRERNKGDRYSRMEYKGHRRNAYAVAYEMFVGPLAEKKPFAPHVRQPAMHQPGAPLRWHPGGEHG